jgi:hypothetical protein
MLPREQQTTSAVHRRTIGPHLIFAARMQKEHIAYACEAGPGCCGRAKAAAALRTCWLPVLRQKNRLHCTRPYEIVGDKATPAAPETYRQLYAADAEYLGISTNWRKTSMMDSFLKP